MLLLKGTVLDKKNNPAPGVMVALMDKRKAATTSLTDEKGKYQIEVPYNKSNEIKFSGPDIYPTTLIVEAALPKGTEEKSDTTSLPAMTAYKLDDPDVNPEAFKSPWQKIYYDAGLKSFLADKEVSNAFSQKLTTTPDNRLLLVEGKTVNSKGKSIEDAKVYLISNNVVLDSAISDNRGRYAFRLPYQREYRLTTKTPGYFETYAAVSTKTANSDEKLLDKKLKNFDLILVKKDEQRINSATLYTPTALARYDADKGEFVIDENVDKQYLASLYLPEPKPEKPVADEVQLEVTQVEAKVEVVDQPVVQENVAKPFVASKNQSAKNDIMMDFHQTLKGVSKTFNYENLNNVSLESQSISNTGFEVESVQGGRLNENDMASIDTRNLINEIAAGIYGFRKGQIELFSLDSTLNVNLNTRIFRTNEGIGVYQIFRNKVLKPGESLEYVHVQDWWFIDTYYRNGKVISESQYKDEMALHEQNGIVIITVKEESKALDDSDES
jgi:hypothetical protein